MSSEIALENTPKLHERLYNLNYEETAFYQAQTGIQDEEELKAHITAVQRQAFAIHPYPCIQRFAFTRLKISRLPEYPRVLEIGRNRENPILLDIGCCFGNDIRKVIADGFPAAGCVGSDLRPEFWDLGHALFKSNPSSFPVPFVAGDAFDKAMISPEGLAPPIDVDSPVELSELSSQGSLNALRGRVDVIHASSFFHLFKEEPQNYLAHALGCLLSKKPGSIILGSHGGLNEKGFRPSPLQNRMFCHSPVSWQELWEGVLGKDNVKVDARIVHEHRPDFQGSAYGERGRDWELLVWSVTRL